MIRRIDSNISQSSDLAKRSGDILREKRRGRINRDSGPSERDLGASNEVSEPSVVEVSRIWDSGGIKEKGRFDAYNQFYQAPLGLYVDVYA